MTDFRERRYQKDPSVVYREVAGEQILIPIRKHTADMSAIFVLNETGARVWTLVDGHRSIHDIAKQLVKEYIVDDEAALQDVVELIEQLKEAGLVRALHNGM